ncbi:hypothetical protein D3C76_1619000 [compost metagenome]
MLRRQEIEPVLQKLNRGEKLTEEEYKVYLEFQKLMDYSRGWDTTKEINKF